jgi:phospholipid/cholesterol/gamma-HCH transport system ATP-binding protein
MEKRSLIQVQDLTVRYGNAVVLDSLDFEVNAGEVFVILGGSGCGKTTLMNTMVGLLDPVCGRVLIDGCDMVGSVGKDRLALLDKIGVMFQGGALFGSMTLLENVRLVLEEKTTLPQKIMDVVARHKLKSVGLEDFADYMPAEISGGMQKRAAIARAMAMDPQILFLDEPSAGLDPVTAASLDQLMLCLSRVMGVTLVVVSHELASIETIADRVIMLQDGKIIAQGAPQALRDHSENAFVKQFFNREATKADGQ